MLAGNLRRQVLIQQRGATVDTYGQRSTTWSDLVTTMADIQPLQGRELELAQAINAEVTHLVVMRYRPGITAAMRVVYQGRRFAIHSVMDVDTRHKTLQLACAEGLADVE